ncbi:unnamed protein product [Protopolystoma xenopodis]|uniref:Uncharacterized protein n=1 Tax=Protopolystoma xenopodis TaxID=117903 RepID=A0A3S5FGK8_9PLAT|nr:unnamed protein product [Protopolystoma xenopodis]
MHYTAKCLDCRENAVLSDSCKKHIFHHNISVHTFRIYPVSTPYSFFQYLDNRFQEYGRYLQNELISALNSATGTRECGPEEVAVWKTGPSGTEVSGRSHSVRNESKVWPVGTKTKGRLKRGSRTSAAGMRVATVPAEKRMGESGSTMRVDREGDDRETTEAVAWSSVGGTRFSADRKAFSCLPAPTLWFDARLDTETVGGCGDSEHPVKKEARTNTTGPECDGDTLTATCPLGATDALGNGTNLLSRAGHRLANLADICQSMKMQLNLIIVWAKALPCFQQLPIKSQVGNQKDRSCTDRSRDMERHVDSSFKSRAQKFLLLIGFKATSISDIRAVFTLFFLSR